MPARVTVISGIVAILAALLFLLASFSFFGCKRAYAFEYGGNTYPDTLAGATVSLGSVLTLPPASIQNTWYSAHTSTSNTSNGNLTSSYLHFEWLPNDTAHDWIFAVARPNVTPSGGTSSSTVQYAFDYQANAWWGLASGSDRPTITFYSGFSSDTIFSNHDFIVWVVNNSDYRTRYEGERFTPPEVDWDSSLHVFSWILDVNNVQSNLRIYKASTLDSMPGQLVYSEIPSTTIGAFAPDSDGFYTLRWTYQIAGISYTYDYAHEYLVGPANSTGVPMFASFEYGVEPPGNILTTYWGGNASPVSGVLQVSEGGQWVNVSTQSASLQASGGWVIRFTISKSGTYRVVAQPSGVVADVGAITYEQSEFNFTQAIQNVAQWVGDFVNSVGLLFSWLPTQVTNLLVAVLSVMVILGLIGWLKS